MSLERKECVRYLGVLIDSNLSWKHHVTYISTKISKSLGILARLRHFVPSNTLLNMYQSLIQPYLSYDIAVWGQAARTNLERILVLQKCALCLIYFQLIRFHALQYLCLNYRMFFLLIFFNNLPYYARCIQ